MTLGVAALATIAYGVVEALGGWWTGSLALLSDAGHMLTDGAALGLGALAAWIARRPPSSRHSYGLGRAEVVAALVNAGAMLVIEWFPYHSRGSALPINAVCTSQYYSFQLGKEMLGSKIVVGMRSKKHWQHVMSSRDSFTTRTGACNMLVTPIRSD